MNRRRRAVIAAALLVLSTSISARADDNRDCLIDGEVLRNFDADRVFAACHRLARDGDAVAQFNLGVMYQNGEGVPRSLMEAARWFHKAADQGYGDAEFNLGIMHADGRGVPRDYVLAHMWLTLAAGQGDAEAARNRDALAGRMTPAQLAEAMKLAAEWRPSTGP